MVSPLERQDFVVFQSSTGGCWKEGKRSEEAEEGAIGEAICHSMGKFCIIHLWG
jgi:hypothetical protein